MIVVLKREATPEMVALMAKRVEELGERIEVLNLSPHDCRHYWATRAGAGVEAGKFSLFQLQEAGGWKTLAMPRHYVEWAAIANRGMV